MIKILITGPIKPPFGGISIHIDRLISLLNDQFEFDFIDESSLRKKEYYNIRSLNPFIYLKKIYNSDLLFVHSGNNFFKKLHIVIGKLFQKKIIITIHGYRNKHKSYNKFIDQIVFQLSDKIILVNDEILNRISIKKREKIIIKHAFLPPVLENENDLPEKIKIWIFNAKKNNQIILCANASRLENYNSQDLYGLDLCYEATIRLLSIQKPIKLIFIVSDLSKGEEKFKHYTKLIAENNLSDHILLLNENVSFVKVILESDIVLRPTNTDGDALTIREAIYFNKKVIASDIVNRPKGTIIFKNRDVIDFKQKIENTIQILLGENINKHSSHLLVDKTFKEFYLNIIHSSLKKNVNQ
jgi:hypothetical protein